MEREEFQEERPENKKTTDPKKRRIGFFGGTFDPIHIGHLISAETVYYKCNLEKVVFIPAYDPPHKIARSKNASDRLRMLELAIEGNPHFEVDDREIVSKEVNYTLNTVLSLIEDNPEAEICYIMGEDSLLQIETWHRWQDLLDLVHIIAVRRPDSYKIAFSDGKVKEKTLEAQIDFLNSEGYKITVVDEFPLEISSSKLRAYLEDGKDIRYLLPDKVLEYIHGAKLYVR